MSGLFQSFLIWHIILGLAGTILSVVLLLALIKLDTTLKYLKSISMAVFLSFLLTWITGGYYYVLYYGKSVKPLIQAGQFSWIHSIFMETKEHIFLFLPILSAIVMIVIWILGKEIEPLKKNLRSVAALMVVLSIAVTLMGAAISGSVSKPKPQNPGQVIKLFQIK